MRMRDCLLCDLQVEVPGDDVRTAGVARGEAGVGGVAAGAGRTSRTAPVVWKRTGGWHILIKRFDWSRDLSRPIRSSQYKLILCNVEVAVFRMLV